MKHVARKHVSCRTDAGNMTYFDQLAILVLMTESVVINIIIQMNLQTD